MGKTLRALRLRALGWGAWVTLETHPALHGLMCRIWSLFVKQYEHIWITARKLHWASRLPTFKVA